MSQGAPLSNERRDRALGMQRRITRRDFLQGTALALGAPLYAPWLEAHAARGWIAQGVTAQDTPGYYPPALTGLRGSHPGSFDIGHALRDGGRWPTAKRVHDEFDLIVVGAGISGLATAYFYRAKHPAARILILDNHDDFGGHARRNEFKVGGRLQLMNGGTLSIESPKPYSEVAAHVLKDLGIDASSITQDKSFYSSLGLASGVFFDRETFGEDKLVRGGEEGLSASIADQAPMSAAAKRDLQRIESATEDFLPDLSPDEKKQRLSAISYQDFLLDVVKADPAVCDYYRKKTHGLWGVGIDAVSALDCWGVDMPGFKGMKLPHGSIARMGYTAAQAEDHGWGTSIHFPDGNATVARALIRRLIPGAVPGSTVQDLVSARADYSKLDRAGQPVRLRLNATAVHAQNLNGGEVAVTYVRGSDAFEARAPRCVLACWNMIIPYLCPEMPDAQKAALHAPTKVPLIYASVALRNWKAMAKLGVKSIYAPGSYYSDLRLNDCVSIGTYATARSPDEPMLLHLTRTPCAPGLKEAEQNRAGRADILSTTFETYEREMRSLLSRSLSAGGFDPARDIAGFTVNRWPHGYAHEYNPLFDELLPPERQLNVVGRARFGRIAIANSDAAAAAYTDSAIDEAYRAVGELAG